MHSKQWHYSLHRDFQNCYSTRRSPTGFFSSNSSSNSTRVPMQHLHLHVHTTLQIHPENSPSRNPILHAEDKELFEYYTTDSRNSMHRRQGDLLEMHPCVLQDLSVTFQAFSRKSLQRQLQLLQLLQRHFSLSRHSSLSSHSRHSRDIPDIPVIHDLPAFLGNSSNSTLFQYLQGFHPIPAFSN